MRRWWARLWPKMMSRIQIQHALIILGGGGGTRSRPRHPTPYSLNLQESPHLVCLSHLQASSQLPLPAPPQPHHLSGEVVKDVAAVGVEDGNGLREVVPLRGRGRGPAGVGCSSSLTPREEVSPAAWPPS